MLLYCLGRLAKIGLFSAAARFALLTNSLYNQHLQANWLCLRKCTTHSSLPYHSIRKAPAAHPVRWELALFVRQVPGS